MERLSKPMSKSIYLLISCFLIFGNSFAQLMEYDIVKGSKTIGSLTAEKLVVGDTTIVTITSEAKFKLLFTFNVSYLLEEKFVDGVLVYGKAINYLNDNVQKESEVFKLENGYDVLLNGDKTSFDLNKIYYSIPNLYFDQPPNLDITIFSQQFAEFLPLYKRPNDEYELESSNGNNMYYYNNGILEKVKVSRTYATFYFVLKQ